MLEQQEASSVPGKLLQSSHCFPSCGDGAWESSSFHHKNNLQLSQQLPQPPSASRTLNPSRDRSHRPVRAREGSPPPPRACGVPLHQEPPTQAPWSRPWRRPADALCALARREHEHSSRAALGTPGHNSPGSSRPQRHPPHHNQPSQDTRDTAPSPKAEKTDSLRASGSTADGRAT